MNREARSKKASLVKKAIEAMRNEIVSASGPRKAELFQDIAVAQADYDALMDFDTFGDDMFVDEAPAFDVGFGANDPADLPSFGVDPVDALPEAFEPAPLVDEFIDSFPGDDVVPYGGDDFVFASGWEQTHREHVSYILDKVADITAAIEKHEQRAASANRTANTGGVRKVVAGYMKRLAQVVNDADFSKEAAGADLDAVGVDVVAMHRKMGL